MPRNYLKALFEKRHYRALYRLFRDVDRPLSFLYTYCSGKGVFPQQRVVKTPLGILKLDLYSFHDVLTMNEIFLRRDYGISNTVSVVVDIGSNIGISLLYFLSRGESVTVYGFEPVEKNLKKLHHHLQQNGFASRALIQPCAIADFSGESSFAVESSGRYGGLNLTLEENIRVEVKNINSVLKKILTCHERISLLKIDTEGNEEKILAAIDEEYLTRIDRIYCEADNPFRLPYFKLKKEGHLIYYENCNYP